MPLQTALPGSEPRLEPPGAFPVTPGSEYGQHAVSGPQSLSQEVRARRAEYVRKKTIKIKVGSWNVASIKGTEKDLGSWFVDGLGVKGLSQDLAGLNIESSSIDGPYESQIESVERQEQRQRKKINTLPKNDTPGVPHGDEVSLYVLGLQEVVDITSATEAVRQYTDTHAANRWIQALDEALPKGYVKVVEQQLLGLLLIIYASPEIASSVSSASSTSVGTGVLGYLGNKGATSARIMLGETTRLVFINCHLAAGSEKQALERRNWDAGQILARTKFSRFEANDGVAEDFDDMIGDEDFAFWFGDLNYRLADIPGDDVRRLLLLHTRNEYDISNKSKRKIDSELGYISAVEDPKKSAAEDDVPIDVQHDPASLHTTLQSLLPHDELHAQQRLRRAFHNGWREGDITFLPTYKYDVGSIGMFDSGEKKRGPSWCDRILYRTRRDVLEYNKRAKEEAAARKKDAEMEAQGLAQAASEENVLYEYDPDSDGLAYGDDYNETEDNFNDAQLIQTQDGFIDSITLDHYVSHQRVLSSDHKPLDAVFTLTYDSVIPELKAKVHQDVAKELDRAENEARPGVTLVVDDLSDGTTETADEPSDINDTSGVNFGEVRYDIPKTCGVTVANTGRVPATFSLVDRPVAEHMGAGITPSWLNIEVQRSGGTETGLSESCTIPPGETAYVKMTITIVDFEQVHELNEGTATMDAVLVLLVHDGRDHFIPVRGTWLQSCFCRTLEELTRRGDGGVRRPKDAVISSNPTGAAARQSAPPELFALTEAIQDLVVRTIAEWDMTHGSQQHPWQASSNSSSWPFLPETWTLPQGEERAGLMSAAREALDTSTPIADHLPLETTALVRLEVVSEVLLLFLQSLRDGVVPASLWADIEEQIASRDKAKTITTDEMQAIVLDILSSSPVHSISFTFLTFMLTKAANEVAPAASSTNPAATRSPRKSISSAHSAEAGEVDSVATSSPTSPGKTSVFPSFRRRKNVTNTSEVSEAETQASNAPARRRAVEQAYAKIFAPIMIRSVALPGLKEKDKKSTRDRKVATLEAFLQGGT